MKVGDIVRYNGKKHGISQRNPIDMDGVISKISSPVKSLPILVRWENGETNDYEESDLILFGMSVEVDSKFMSINDLVEAEVQKLRGTR